MGTVVFLLLTEMHTLVQLFSQYEQLAVLRLCSKVYTATITRNSMKMLTQYHFYVTSQSFDCKHSDSHSLFMDAQTINQCLQSIHGCINI